MKGKNPGYRCPRCKYTFIIEYEGRIECTMCHLEFFKEILEIVDEDDVLAISEMECFVKAFED